MDRPDIRLKGSKLEFCFRISPDNKLNNPVAKITNTIEENEYRSVAS